MARKECAKGLPRLSPAAVSPSARLFVSFDYTGDAETEVARFFKQTGKVIVLLTVRQIAPPSPAAVSLRSALDEQIAHRLA